MTMSQQARPIADISAGNWLTAPLYSKIGESSPSDSDYVSVTNPNADTFEVLLSTIFSPPWIKGSKFLKVRLRRTTTTIVPVVLELMQGNTRIARRAVTPDQSFGEYDLALRQAEINSITNYSNLRLRVSASCPSIATSCCPGVLLGNVLFGRISNKTGNCVCMPDYVEMHYGGFGGSWAGDALGCSSPSSWTVHCKNDDTWAFNATNLAGDMPPVSVQCDPFELDYGTLDGSGVCGGAPGASTFDLVFARTPN
jgi:hypothetical protein